MATVRDMRSRVRALANEPVNGASLGLLRMAFGILMMFAVVRFFAYGWIEDFYVMPEFHFPFVPGVQPWGGVGMYVHFAVMGLSAALFASGRFYRQALLLFLILFIYVELIDKTTYLNHYYFVSLLAFLLILAPANQAFVLGKKGAGQVAGGWVMLLRAQVGVVYFFAGVAKLSPDWLLRGQPLGIWLKASGDFPLIGSFFHQDWVALAGSWAGAAFDLSVPFLLLYRRTRPFAFVAVVVFHVVTWKLFYLGLFPWIMICAATIFFAPDWPVKLLARLRIHVASLLSVAPGAGSTWWRRHLLVPVLSIYLLLQVLVPLRSHLYEGNGLWTEQGFRFSWKVMLMEKAGHARFFIRTDDGRSFLSYPEDHLTTRQARMMATQPDMIVQFAHYLADVWRARGYQVVGVHVESFAALNGRMSQPFMDSQVNLLNLSEYQAGAFVLPLAGGGDLVYQVGH